MKIKKGFSIIEIMVVVVIIGILAAIGFYNYSKIINKAKVVSLEANMHSLEISVELYATDHGGAYPVNSDTTGLGKYLFKNTRDPYDNSKQWFTNTPTPKLGQVSLWTDSFGSHYTIKGMGKNGFISLEYDR